MPYTTVVAGTTITAAWGNVVRDQLVTPFATAAARTSAITSPVTGMLSYRSDGDVFDGYNGSAWKPVAGIRNIKTFSGLNTCSLSTTSSSYVDITNASTSWAKGGASGDTDILVAVSVSIYATGATTTQAYLGINIAGTDYDVCLALITQASVLAGTWVGFSTITGVAAGSYTPKLRAKRSAGSGTLTVDVTNSTVAFLVAELPK
jgi:hypothetical protein